jgi:hypothetical protein
MAVVGALEYGNSQGTPGGEPQDMSRHDYTIETARVTLTKMAENSLDIDVKGLTLPTHGLARSLHYLRASWFPILTWTTAPLKRSPRIN